MFKRIMLLTFIAGLFGCADSFYKKEENLDMPTIDKASVYQKNTFYKFSGFQSKKGLNGVEDVEAFDRVESYSYINENYMERNTIYNFKNKNNSYNTVEYISENVELGEVYTHIAIEGLEEVCFNFNGEQCTGKPEFLYNVKGLPNVSINYTGNTLIGLERQKEFDTFFHYYQNEDIDTNFGKLSAQKIKFSTFAINKDNEIVNRFGYYWWNEKYGVLKKSYREVFGVDEKGEIDSIYISYNLVEQGVVKNNY